MEVRDGYVALAAQLQKTFKSLSLDGADALATGQASIVVLAGGQRLVDDQPGLDLILKAVATLPADKVQAVSDLVARAVKALKAEDLDAVAASGSSFKFARKGGRLTYPVDVPEIARTVSELSSEDGIIKFLDADDRLKPTDLRRLGDQLGVTFPPSVKQRPAMIAHLARSVASF